MAAAGPTGVLSVTTSAVETEVTESETDTDEDGGAVITLARERGDSACWAAGAGVFTEAAFGAGGEVCC